MATNRAWVVRGVCVLALTLMSFVYLHWGVNNTVPAGPYAESFHHANAMANELIDSDSDSDFEPNVDPNPNSTSDSDSNSDPNSDTASNSKSDTKTDSDSDSRICGSNPPENDAPCSLKIFQAYYSVCNKLPDAGTWSNVSDFTKPNGTLPRFRTPLCRPHAVTSDALVTRLEKTDIRRILMVGDSHGFRYFESLHGYISSAMYVCKLIIREEGPRDGPVRNAVLPLATLGDADRRVY
jgi:hypothetical protein